MRGERKSLPASSIRARPAVPSRPKPQPPTSSLAPPLLDTRAKPALTTAGSYYVLYYVWLGDQAKCGPLQKQLTPAMRPCVKWAIAGRSFANDSIRLLSVLEAPVMYANVNLGCAIFQRGSRPTRSIRANPNRVRSFCSLECFPRAWPLTCFPHGVGFEPLALQAPSLLCCCLPGSQPATSVIARTGGVVGHSTASSFLAHSCPVIHAGAFSSFALTMRFPVPRRAAGGTVRPSR